MTVAATRDRIKSWPTISNGQMVAFTGIEAPRAVVEIGKALNWRSQRDQDGAQIYEISSRQDLELKTWNSGFEKRLAQKLSASANLGVEQRVEAYRKRLLAASSAVAAGTVQPGDAILKYGLNLTTEVGENLLRGLGAEELSKLSYNRFYFFASNEVGRARALPLRALTAFRDSTLLLQGAAASIGELPASNPIAVASNWLSKASEIDNVFITVWRDEESVSAKTELFNPEGKRLSMSYSKIEHDREVLVEFVKGADVVASLEAVQLAKLLNSRGQQVAGRTPTSLLSGDPLASSTALLEPFLKFFAASHSRSLFILTNQSVTAAATILSNSGTVTEKSFQNWLQSSRMRIEKPEQEDGCYKLVPVTPARVQAVNAVDFKALGVLIGEATTGKVDGSVFLRAMSTQPLSGLPYFGRSAVGLYIDAVKALQPDACVPPIEFANALAWPVLSKLAKLNGVGRIAISPEVLVPLQNWTDLGVSIQSGRENLPDITRLSARSASTLNGVLSKEVIVYRVLTWFDEGNTRSTSAAPIGVRVEDARSRMEASYSLDSNALTAWIKSLSYRVGEHETMKVTYECAEGWKHVAYIPLKIRWQGGQVPYGSLSKEIQHVLVGNPNL